MNSMMVFPGSPLHNYISPTFSPESLFEHEYSMSRQMSSKPIVYGPDYSLYPPSPPHSTDGRVAPSTAPPALTIITATPEMQSSLLIKDEDQEDGENASKKKQLPKKRKSWGQELPTPTTNLPPRKRAKTAEEKEQRRIERVLRNRHAAQMSRERKRLEYEHLEAENDYLKSAIANFTKVMQDMHNDRVVFGAEVYESCKNYVPPAVLPKLLKPSPIAVPAPLADFRPFQDPLSPESHDGVDFNSSPVEPRSPAGDYYESMVKPEAVETIQHPTPLLLEDMPCRPPTAPQLDYESMYTWQYIQMAENQHSACQQQAYNPHMGAWQTNMIPSPGLVLI